ncbi:MAG: DnaD domain protein [Clostridia bacterium]|nr:DnaD domain protein [Clostridia bacterium]
MKYHINTESLGSTFMLPTPVIDKWIKLASNTQLKVILYVFRNIANGLDAENTAKALGLGIDEVSDALSFWEERGLLCSEKEVIKEKETKNIVQKTEMPTREDVIARGLEDDNVKLIMREAQIFFGRGLKQNESSWLLYLYDDCGMDPAVILCLLSHSAAEGKCNLNNIKKTSNRWLKEGVETVADAERIINLSAREELAWRTVQSIFGMEKRNPSEKEKALAFLWLTEWEIPTDILKAAYDTCVDTTSKFSFPYVAKIVEKWHKKGYKTVEDVKENPVKKKAEKNRSFAGYDLDDVYEILNRD